MSGTGPGLFVPSYYRADDPAAAVRAHPFALLVTAESGIRATSIPIFFESDAATATMIGHMARRNPHAGSLRDGEPVLAVFSGPHAYVSPRWYVEMPEVPTWNYIVAHVRGTIHPIDDEAGQIAILERSAAILEADTDTPWKPDQASGRVSELLSRIRSFRIRVEQIEGATKLSQRHPASDRARVAEQLAAKGDGNSMEIAALMRALPESGRQQAGESHPATNRRPDSG